MFLLKWRMKKTYQDKQIIWVFHEKYSKGLFFSIFSRLPITINEITNDILSMPITYMYERYEKCTVCLYNLFIYRMLKSKFVKSADGLLVFNYIQNRT